MEATLQRVQTILRRDLKLGDNAPIPADMPFFGGDIDLDSLDILLLVTSIEKEFGVKIPSSAAGQEIFQNVTTLCRYIEQNAGGENTTAAASSGTSSQPIDYLTRLPHGEGFRFISKVTSVREGEAAEGVWSVSGSESFFAAHFPGNPIVPGVYIIEAMAQLSGLAGPAGGASGAGGAIAHVDIRFNKPVAPPAEVVLNSKFARAIAELQQFDVSAAVAGETVASGTITLHRPSPK